MNSNGVISAPISNTDIQTVIQTTDNQLAEWCSHFNINQWSKYKPVPLSDLGHPNDRWYQGNNGFCGLSIGYTSAAHPNLVPIMTAYKEGTYIHTPPKGGMEEPFRMIDFNGYNHNAKPFMRSKKAKGEMFTVNMFDTDTLTISVTYEEFVGSLTLSDFESIGAGIEDAHLAVALFNSNPVENLAATQLQVVISDTSIKEGGSVSLSFSESDISTTRYVMLYLASITVSNNICMPYDDDNYIAFKVNISQNPPLEMTLHTVISSGATGTVASFNSDTNPLPTDGGNMEYLFYVVLKNNSLTKNITFGNNASSDYRFRMAFRNYMTVADMLYVDASGVIIGTDRTIAPGGTWNAYFKVTGLFLNYWDGLLVDIDHGDLYCEAQILSAPTTLWYSPFGTQHIYIKK